MAVQRLDVHRIRCPEMPTPVEMAAHYLADSQVTLLTLASCYRVAVKVIRERLEFGLNALGHEWEQVQAARRDERGVYGRPRLVQNGRKCASCEMLLTDDDPHTLCVFCRPGAVDYLRFVSETMYEAL